MDTNTAQTSPGAAGKHTHLAASQIDVILEGLASGMGCLAVQEATGVCHNIVREVLRGDQRDMSRKHRAEAMRIRGLKHSSQLRSIGPKQRRKRLGRIHGLAPDAARSVRESVIKIFEPRIAELEEQGRQMRAAMIDKLV